MTSSVVFLWMACMFPLDENGHLCGVDTKIVTHSGRRSQLLLSETRCGHPSSYIGFIVDQSHSSIHSPGQNWPSATTLRRILRTVSNFRIVLSAVKRSYRVASSLTRRHFSRHFVVRIRKPQLRMRRVFLSITANMTPTIVKHVFL